MSSTHVDGILARMVANDAVLPAQFNPTRRVESWAVELLEAMFSDALSRLRFPGSVAGKEAIDWFLSGRTSWGSFLFACSVLDRDPAFWRAGAIRVFKGERFLPHFNRRLSGSKTTIG